MGTKSVQKKGLLYLSKDDLLTHPKNLRRFYPEYQVREMAESIRAVGGVLQALLIVHSGQAGKYFVVDGNMRLAGARALGDECPPLKCEIVDKGKAEQLLAMVVTAKFRYEPDPISEALHYKRLIEEEGYSAPRISRATGTHTATIYTRLKLLELDPEIQELIGNRKLPSAQEAINALLSISDPRVRVKLAQRLAKDEPTIKAVVAACDRLLSQLGKVSASKTKGSPALAHQETSGAGINRNSTVDMEHVRDAAKATCKECDIRLGQLSSAPEPAWALITHAAEQTCDACNIREVIGACKNCPAVDIMRNLINAMTVGRA
ncbi:MAG: hypothetical protein AB1553_01865 [Nitrospirota bacterium]